MTARGVGLGANEGGTRRRDAARPCFTPSFRRRERPCADGSVPARRLLGIGALLASALGPIELRLAGHADLGASSVTAASSRCPSTPPLPPPPAHTPPPPPSPLLVSPGPTPRWIPPGEGVGCVCVCGGGYRSSLQVALANGAGPPPPPRTKRYHKRCVKSRGSGGEEGRDNII